MSPLALIDWWSEIFEVPAVAFDGENVHAFAAQAAAGADFVAVAMTPGQDLSAAVDGLREAAAAIQASPAGAGS
jgi:thiamine monophosphate synthase